MTAAFDAAVRSLIRENSVRKSLSEAEVYMKDRVFGTIIRIRGPVIDIRFAEGEEPKINSLVSTENGNFHMEVAAHISAGTVRCVALEATEGAKCGLRVWSDGEGIKVPVGDGVIGRVVDVLGRPIDCKVEIKAERYMPIHR